MHLTLGLMYQNAAMRNIDASSLQMTQQVHALTWLYLTSKESNRRSVRAISH